METCPFPREGLYLVCRERKKPFGGRHNGIVRMAIGMEYAILNNGLNMPMAGIAALDKNTRYYTSTPEMLEMYAKTVPDVDGQKKK